MKTNVESLKTLYTKLGGALTDTYPDIAGGIPVGEYDLISDCILACSEKSSGGGGDEYETVAEIPVGTMEYSEEIDVYVADGLSPSQTLPRSSNDLYFNNAAYPLTYYADEPAYVYNLDMATGTATGTPSYAVLFDGSTVNIVSDTNAIENTTVKILKKVTGGETITVDSELDADSENPVQNKVIMAALADKMDADEIPEADASANGKVLGVNNGVYALVSPSALDDYVITLTVTVDPDTQDSTMSADKSIAEIYAAIEAGKNCYAELEEEINGVTMMQRFYPTMYCATMVVFGGNLVAAGGSGIELDPVCIVGVHAGNMDTWSAVGN